MDWRDSLMGYFPPAVRTALTGLSAREAQRVTEIRVRAEKPVQLLMLGEEKQLAALPSGEEVSRMAQALLGHACYAREEELRRGYVTLPGGCRAGLCGHAVLSEGRLHHLQDIGSVALRIARAAMGAADPLMRHILTNRMAKSMLLISAPGRGKTTVLRDAARQASEAGSKVSVVDERSELAACVRGVPQLDVGPRTDVLDGCPKAEGMLLMLRAFSPDILVTDELGGDEDARAVLEAARGGVAVWATAHADSLNELRSRPSLGPLVSQGAFARLVLLEQAGLPGRVAAVWDAEGKKLA